MYKKIIIFLLLLFIPFFISAEELKIDWKTSWGGNDDEEFFDVYQTKDGGFLAYGYSESTDIEGLPNKGVFDAIIIKYDKDGNLMWQTSWGGNSVEEFYDVYQTKDGGFLAYGYSWSTDIEGLPNKGEGDAIIIKYDKDGNLMWQKSWGGNASEEFYNVYQTEDVGFLAYGYLYSTDIEGLPNKGERDEIIIKYDKDGNLMWQTSWGGNDDEEFSDVYQTEDGGFLAYGYSYSTDIEGLPNKGLRDAIIIKYDKDGNLMWQTSWGGNRGEHIDYVYQTKDGGFLAYGGSVSTDIEGLPNKGSYDAIIIKYDKDGNLMWQTSWGGNNSDEFYDVYQTKDSGFLAYGYSNSTDIEGLPNKGSYDAIIIKYDKDGNLMWQKSWGGNNSDEFSDLYQTEDGGFLAYGYSWSTDVEGLLNKGASDAIIIKYDKDGNLMWQKSWGGERYDEFLDVYQTKDGGFLAYGYSYSTDIEGLPNKDSDDAISIKYDKDGNLMWQTSWGGNGEEGFYVYQTEDGGFLAYGVSSSIDIEGLPNKGFSDVIIVKYSIEYELENIVSENGVSTVEQQGKYGITTPTPNDGYEVDNIIIKDKNGNVLDVEITKLENGAYSFELYTDVSVEVLFKEKLVNPKTGVNSFIGVIFTMLLISISGFFVIRNYNNNYEF